jgi:integrase
MDPKTRALLDRLPDGNTIKTFDEAFELTCQVRPSWNLNRGKKSQAENVRRDFKKFQQIAGIGVPLDIMINRPNFLDSVRDEAQETFGWSNSTVNKFLSMISTVYEQARRQGASQRTPDIVYLPQNTPRCEWFTKDQVEQLSKLAKSYGDDLFGDLILFAAYTGLRSQELRKLRVGDFDFRGERPTITVGGTPDTSTKTDESGVSWRVVPLPDRILPLSQRLADSIGYTVRPFNEFFPNRQVIARHFDRVRRLIMLEDRTITKMHKFKSLRDSFGTWQCAAGVPLVMVSRIMGHTNTKQTLKYVHNTSDYIRETGNSI